jgi:hypothetical protein
MSSLWSTTSSSYTAFKHISVLHPLLAKERATAVEQAVSSLQVLSQFFDEDRVHHRLEGSWGVSKAKEHDSWFEEAFVGDEGCLPLVLFLDTNIVVSPSYVEL